MRKVLIITLISAFFIASVLVSTSIIGLPSPSATPGANESLRDIVTALNLRGVAVLDAEVEDTSKLGDFEVLFLDNLWLQSKRDDATAISWLKDIMLNGVPTIAFGSEIDSDFLYDLMTAQMREITNQHIIAQGFHIKEGWLFLEGTKLTRERVADAYNWAATIIS